MFKQMQTQLNILSSAGRNCWWKTVYSTCVWEYFTGISVGKSR